MIVAGGAETYANPAQFLSRKPPDVPAPGVKQEQNHSAHQTRINSGDTAFGSKLAAALLTMEEQGVVLDQPAQGTWLKNQPKTEVAEDFVKLSEMTFAERIRFFYLDERDMSEKDLDAMTPEARGAIEEQIRQVIMETLGLNRDDEQATEGTNGTAPQSETGPVARNASTVVYHYGEEEDPLFALWNNGMPPSTDLPEASSGEADKQSGMLWTR